MLHEENIPEIFRKNIKRAVEILIGEGCKKVYIFGSVARGTSHVIISWRQQHLV